MNIVNKALILACFFIFNAEAYAYVGPGAGLTALGSIIAFIGAVLLMIAGFLWYPIKRLLKSKKQTVKEKAEKAGESTGQPSE